jgi:hypothetical protein
LEFSQTASTESAALAYTTNEFSGIQEVLGVTEGVLVGVGVGVIVLVGVGVGDKIGLAVVLGVVDGVLVGVTVGVVVLVGVMVGVTLGVVGAPLTDIVGVLDGVIVGVLVTVGVGVVVGVLVGVTVGVLVTVGVIVGVGVLDGTGTHKIYLERSEKSTGAVAVRDGTGVNPNDGLYTFSYATPSGPVGGHPVALVPCGPGAEELAINENRTDPLGIEGDCTAKLAEVAYEAVFGTPNGNILLKLHSQIQ